MARALSSIIPSTIFVIAMAILSLYSVYTLTSSFLSMLRIANSVRVQGYAITISNVAVYANGTFTLALYNNGATSIPNISELDIVVVYIDSLLGKEVTYLLRPGINWFVEKVCVSSLDRCFNLSFTRSSLKPGEVAVLRGVLSETPYIGSWGFVAVITPTGWKAEKAFVVGSLYEQN